MNENNYMDYMDTNDNYANGNDTNSRYINMNSNNEEKDKVKSIISLVCSSLGLLLMFIFTIIICSAGPNLIIDTTGSGRSSARLEMSDTCFLNIIPFILQCVGLMMGLPIVKKNSKYKKIALISVIVSAVAMAIGILSTITMCSLNSQIGSRIH